MAKNNRKKKSSHRRNTKHFKSVDPFWQENPNKLKAKIKAQDERRAQNKEEKSKNQLSNKKLRLKAIDSLVKKNAKAENDEFYKKQRENKKLRYKQLPGESLKEFKERMQHDVDTAINESLQNKKSKLADIQDTQFKSEIRQTLLAKDKILEKQIDKKDSTRMNSKAYLKKLEKSEKQVKSLDQQIEKEEQNQLSSKVNFGERVDDIFKPTVVPRRVKKMLAADKKRQKNKLEFLDKTKMSKFKQAMLAEERKRAIETYRQQRKDKELN